jgi:hypothetical protein
MKNLILSAQSVAIAILTDFTIDSGFVAGVNWLMFEVTNDPLKTNPDRYINPSGLLVNIDSATAEPVPEPSPSPSWCRTYWVWIFEEEIQKLI